MNNDSISLAGQIQISHWVREACEANGKLYLFNLIKWRFSDKMTWAAGYAYPLTLHFKLSIPLWERSSEKERENTVKHEVCHIIAGAGHGHDTCWKWAMIKCGLEPKRTHDIDRTGLTRCHYDVVCHNCNHIHKVSKVIIRRMHNGQRRICGKCHSILEFRNAVCFKE